MPNTRYHVTRRSDGDWQYKKPGSSRASGVYDTQHEAEQAAKTTARNNGGGEVTIHGLDGRFRDSDTIAPAHDPFPPRDRKH